jgi:hypothetical protein
MARPARAAKTAAATLAAALKVGSFAFSLLMHLDAVPAWMRLRSSVDT